MTVVDASLNFIHLVLKRVERKEKTDSCKSLCTLHFSFIPKKPGLLQKERAN